ncbi:MAG: GNAT family N-acetyltransferase [Candidatus Eremiobacteraeota bacterium]|nr:GNAT family N-acetyltransferase [Candidatus Eremiobacteraeota bacterium]
MPADIDYIVETDGDREMQKTLAIRPQTLDESRARLARWLDVWENHGYGFWIFSDAGGNRIGHAGIFPSPRVEGSTEVGYALKTAFWNRGYATEMTRAMLKIAADLAIPRLVGITLASNAASRRVMEKVGMAFERECPYADGRRGVLYSLAR